jgi:hypothetical protein
MAKAACGSCFVAPTMNGGVISDGEKDKITPAFRSGMGANDTVLTPAFGLREEEYARHANFKPDTGAVMSTSVRHN